MDVSCLIPTHERPDKLVGCIAGLAAQHANGTRFEVLVGVDGPDHGEADAVAAALAASGAQDVPVRLYVCDKAGPAATRNRLIENARGRVLLFLNDDVRPDRDLVATHAKAHDELGARSQQAMVLGSSPWVIPEDGTLFDRLIRETSMVFFYDQMVGPKAADPDHDWGFRHAWTLNLSVPAQAVRAAGGFSCEMNAPCFEDLEFAHRLSTEIGLGVLYRPAAVVVHDHRYQPRAYLQRERLLGAHAWRLARCAPECAHAVFGRDLLAASEVEYCREFVDRERAEALRLEERFCRLSELSSECVPSGEGETGRELIGLIYQQHLLLKRWWWRTGLIEAARQDAPSATSDSASGSSIAGT